MHLQDPPDESAREPVPGRPGREKSLLKIDRIEIYACEYPTAGYFKFFVGPRGVVGRAAVVVKITADNGVVGWGQSVPSFRWSDETPETVVSVLRDYFAPALIGVDALDLNAAQAALDGALACRFSTAMPIARAGIDLALHDLLGKLTARSLAELWGRSPGGAVTLSWTVNPRNLDELDGLLEEGWRRGYRNFNIKIAPDPVVDLELARRVRRRAPHGFLWADANCGYDLATALEVAPRLADVGVDVLESPLPPNRISGYQRLKQQGALPILMDEGIISPIELEEFVRLGMLDGIAVKPARAGGLLSARRQIELMEHHGMIWLGSGLSDPDIALAASLGLYAAYGLQRPAALNGPQFVVGDVLTVPLSLSNAIATVPAGPGIGVEVDEEKLRQLAVRDF
jgi:L-alanine-DL-glutamate epimerase-like enolase superfamily enzyme